MLAFVFAFAVGVAIRNKIKGYRRDRVNAFWRLIQREGLTGEPPTSLTRLLIERIVQIQTASGGALLPMRQAVKLVAIYERQSRQLQLVREREPKLNQKREALLEKMAELQALGETNAAAWHQLELMRADAEALEKVADDIQDSCARLEQILSSVQKTARARQLHRELNQISASDQPANEPAFAPESLEEIERQIGREIETYLQLERETDQHLQ